MARYETKAHYRSRAGLEPIPRDELHDGKKFILKAIDEAIEAKWKVADDNQRKVWRQQRARVAKFLGVEGK